MGTIFALFTSLLYLFLAVCLIYSRLNWSVKAFLILSTVAVSILGNFAVRLERGTAQDANMPQRFLLAHVLVREPNSRVADAGAVYYLLLETHNGKRIPRLYERPYSEGEHRNATEMQRAIKQADGPIWAAQEGNEEGDGDASLQTRVAKKMMQGAASGVGYYEDTATHGMVPLNSSALPLKQ